MTKEEQKKLALKEYYTIEQPAQEEYEEIRGRARKKYLKKCEAIDKQDEE